MSVRSLEENSRDNIGGLLRILLKVLFIQRKVEEGKTDTNIPTSDSVRLSVWEILLVTLSII